MKTQLKQEEGGVGGSLYEAFARTAAAKAPGAMQELRVKAGDHWLLQPAPRYVHFVRSGLVSHTLCLQDGLTASVHVSTAGECVELLELVTPPEASFRATAMLPTRVVRVPFRLMQQALLEDAGLLMALSRALGVRGLKAAQLSACNAVHDLQGRLARYLSVLCVHGDGPLPITQESLAMELAVRRSSVCLAMHELGKDGVLEFSRGKVVVLDRPALAGKACECLSVFAQPAVAPVTMPRMIHHVPVHESRAALSQ